MQLRTSVVNDGAVDAAVFYEEEIGPVEVDAAFGWANLGDASEAATFDDLFAGSASFLHESGVNLTLAGGTQTRRAAAGDDPVFYYAKLGYQRDFFAFGKTALSVDVHQTNDQQEEGDEARAIGFQFVQNVDDWGMDAFFNFRNHSLERVGHSFDDLNIAMIGARVRF